MTTRAVPDPWADVEVVTPGRPTKTELPLLPHDEASHDDWLRSLRGCGLSPACFAVLIDVGIEAAEGHGSRPADLIAEDYGLTARTVRRHLRHLECEGWLRRTR